MARIINQVNEAMAAEMTNVPVVINNNTKEEKKMTMKERIQAASKKAQDKIGSVNLEEIGMKAAQKSGYGTGYAAATVVYGTKELASKVAGKVVGNKYVQGYTNSVKEGWTAGRTNIYAAKAAAEIEAEVVNC